MIELKNIKQYVKEQKEFIKVAVTGNDVCLCIIQVGDVPASNRYVRNKMKDLEEVGMRCNYIHLPEDTTTDFICNLLDNINDPVIVQLPLPKHIDVDEINKHIRQELDVDGFTPGALCEPCTPKGIIEYLDYCGFNYEGKNAVVIGRSNIVGRPMAKMLLDKNMTVSVIHSHTTEYARRELLHNADLVVCAVGQHGVLRPSLCPNAIIIDVGINFNSEGKMCGDVEIMSDSEKSRVTPVPGGVGILTRLQLLKNTWKCYVNKISTKI